MSLFQPRTVRSSLWPSLAISWGITGASAKVERVWRVLCAMTTTVAMVLLNVYVFSRPRSSIQSDFLMMNHIQTILPYFKIPAGLILIWLWELKCACAVENAITEIGRLDEELKNFGCIFNHKIFMWKQLVTIFAFFVTLLIMIVLQSPLEIIEFHFDTPLNSTSQSLAMLSHQIPQFQSLVADLVFSITLEALYVRFKRVNEIFKNNSQPVYRIKGKILATSYPRMVGIFDEARQNGPEQRYRSSHLLMDKIDRACRIHRGLLKVAEDLRDAFSLHLALGSPILFLHILLITFVMLSAVEMKKDIIVMVLVNVISTTFIAGKFWQVVLSCTKASEEANQLGMLLYQLPVEDAAVHEQLRDYSFHNIQRKLTFTAGGLYNVDRNLIKSVSSTIVKFLVILIQLRNIT